MSKQVTMARHTMRFDYVNYKGKKDTREAVPLYVHHGSSEWHPEPQWMMRAYDCFKCEERDFALKDMYPAGHFQQLDWAFRDLDFAQEVLSKERLAGWDQNPKGVWDVLGNGIQKVKRLARIS